VLVVSREDGFVRHYDAYFPSGITLALRLLNGRSH
jgi:hypothetical protein